MAGSTEQGQRQALSSLLARFTADRDALITSIHGCQERIAELVARLDAAGTPGPVAGSPAPDLDAVRAAIAELQAEQEAALARVAADAALAMDRADAALGAALGAVQQLSSAPAPLDVLDTASGQQLEQALATAGGIAELHAAVESLQAEVARLDAGNECEVRLRSELEADVERRINAVVTHPNPAVEALGTQLARLETTLDERLAGAAGWEGAAAALGARLELLAAEAASAGELRAAVAELQARAAAAPSGGEIAALRAPAQGPEEIRAEVARLEASLDERLAAGLAPVALCQRDLAAVRSNLERLQAAAAADTACRDVEQLRSGAEEMRTSVAEVRHALARMESTMGHYYETMRTTAEGREAELAQLREQVERLAADLAAAATNANAVEELGHAVAELRGDVGRMETTLGDRLESRMRFAQDGWDAEARLLHEELHQLVESQTGKAAGTTGLAEVRTAVEQLRGELGRVHSTLEGRLETRLRAVAEASTSEARRLSERVEQLGSGSGVAGGLEELRQAIAALQRDLAGAGAAVEARVDAKVRAALEGWNAEGRALRARLEQVAATRSDDGRLAATLTDLRTAVEHLRTDVGRMDASLDRRLDARLRTAESAWDVEAGLLRARIDAVAERLAQQARADAEDPLRLRTAAAALGRRLAVAQAIAERVPVLRRAAAIVGAVAWILGGQPARPASSRS